ncbi:hypothetical protein SDC9_131680 [bioreactor metagenome]|uniref:Uncharacterized protein n=1 Tax=bioreactor metagenome TaxID=1076179 RepID=A0A645D5Y0_9ZZZZ
MACCLPGNYTFHEPVQTCDGDEGCEPAGHPQGGPRGTAAQQREQGEDHHDDADLHRLNAEVEYEQRPQ